jgi:hypothetical protein
MFWCTAHAIGSTMKDGEDKGEGRIGAPAKNNSRQDRLKLALRENLKRRKMQARARSDAASEASSHEPAKDKRGH